jgi:hypothetical protein
MGRRGPVGAARSVRANVQNQLHKKPDTVFRIDTNFRWPFESAWILLLAGATPHVAA